MQRLGDGNLEMAKCVTSTDPCSLEIELKACIFHNNTQLVGTLTQKILIQSGVFELFLRPW